MSLSYDPSTRTLALINTNENVKLNHADFFAYQIVNVKSGVLIGKGNLNGDGGRLSLGELPVGGYIVNVQIDDSTMLTEKIVIQ